MGDISIIIHITASSENLIRMQHDISKSLKNESFLQFDFATIKTFYKHRSMRPIKIWGFLYTQIFQILG